MTNALAYESQHKNAARVAETISQAIYEPRASGNMAALRAGGVKLEPPMGLCLLVGGTLGSVLPPESFFVMEGSPKEEEP